MAQGDPNGYGRANLDKSYDYYDEAYQVLKNTGTLKQAIFKTDAVYSKVKERLSFHYR
ncbi:hypothetical protein [Mucilaginibacter sp.]|uniref:hypothetical protein n=1 Tax=Mucilaginibacter sp. TaxID=1882438 RepID=UPI0025CE442E|nr:hypothetical protein [Mucilaginibacter sp.]